MSGKSRPVCLGVGLPSGDHDQICFCLTIVSFLMLGTPLERERGRVCNLLYNCFWSLPEQSLLGRRPSELTTIFYCLILDSPNLEDHVPVLISLRNSPHHPISLRSILILSTHPSLGLPSGLLPTNNLYAFLFSFMLHASPISSPST
jgi:hypothetical protein